MRYKGGINLITKKQIDLAPAKNKFLSLKAVSKSKISDMIKNIILTIFSVFVIYPLLWLVANSLKNRADMVVNSLNLIPKKIFWNNYSEAWVIGSLGKRFINTLIVAVATVSIVIVFCYLASYALARLRFTGRKTIMVLFVGTMMIPVQVIMIPLFKMEVAIHIQNTLIGLILPYAAGILPFCIFVMTAFLKRIPFEIEEAGLIDGCNRRKLIWNIVLPLSKPGLATITIFSFMNVWNEFYLALALVSEPDVKTLNLAILDFQRLWGIVDYTRMFAALVIIILPVITLYTIIQKQFISGLTAGSVKG